MGRATLILDADVSALRRAMGEIPGITQRAQAVMTSQARRGGRERVAVDDGFAREHESISRRLARAREKAAKDAAATERAEARKVVQNDAAFAAQRDSIHAQLARAREARAAAETRREAAEGRRRVAADVAFARERDNIHKRLAAARVARERAAQREVDQLTRERRATGREAGGQVANAVGQAATSTHDRVQAARQTAAERTSAINTALVQRGTSQTENAADNAMIQARLREVRTGVSPEIGIAAIASAQTAANALGGDNRNQRIEGIRATLDDVELAGAIDPTNVQGIVSMGAILRRRMPNNPAMRQRILRGAVGTALEGSVETDQMVTQGLPGLLAAISSGTANAAPADRDRITAEIAQDFFAQLQAQAAGGRTVGVAANRTNTVRDALSNATRQNRLGLALSETARTGTPEQQAAFAAAFTKGEDGQYTMNADVRNTPSNAARFFGTMFNNDAGALRNAMGAHGLGGATQLMRQEDVSAIASYLSMTTVGGVEMRQYDAVDRLKRASLTPEQEATMRDTRAREDRTRIMREQEAAAADARRPGLLTRASDALTSFATANPVTALLGGSATTAALSAGARGLGARALPALARAAPVIRNLGAPGKALALGIGGLMAYRGMSDTSENAPPPLPRNAPVGQVMQRGMDEMFGPRVDLLGALRALPAQIADALRSAPATATVSPHDAAHATSAAPPQARR